MMSINKNEEIYCHNPYFNRWFSAIEIKETVLLFMIQVTILILIDGFLQYEIKKIKKIILD